MGSPPSNLFSSSFFFKVATLPPSLKLTGVVSTRAVLDGIIVTKFGDIQSVFLALVWCDHTQYGTVFVLYDSLNLYPMQRGF